MCTVQKMHRRWSMIYDMDFRDVNIENCTCWRLNTCIEDVYEGKAPDNGLCTADEYKGRVGSQVLRYSSPGLPQMKDRCEVNFKDLRRINSTIYCYNSLKEYIAGDRAKPANCFPTFLFMQLICLERQNRKKGD